MKRYITIAIVILTLAVLFTFVFPGRIILPQYFAIGRLQIHYYGITMALAVLAGYLLARKRAARYGIDINTADDLIFWLVIGGFIGARSYHIMSSIGYYWQHPIDVFKVWNGGLSIYGAVIGGVIVLFAYGIIQNSKFRILNLLDWLAPSVVLGQVIGRFGNLFNYEAFGYPTNLPWKMFVPAGFRPQSLAGFQYFHPLFLYEALGNALILLILLKCFKSSRPGSLFFFYLLLYNVLRFFLEFLRTDSTFIHGLRLNSISSLILVLAAILALFAIRKVKNDQVS